MKTIYKYKWSDTVSIPKGAKILNANFDPKDGELYIWASVDTNEEEIERRLVLVPTGNAVVNDENLRYINTVFQGPFVWHLFEEIEKG